MNNTHVFCWWVPTISYNKREFNLVCYRSFNLFGQNLLLLIGIFLGIDITHKVFMYDLYDQWYFRIILIFLSMVKHRRDIYSFYWCVITVVIMPTDDFIPIFMWLMHYAIIKIRQASFVSWWRTIGFKLSHSFLLSNLVFYNPFVLLGHVILNYTPV